MKIASVCLLFSVLFLSSCFSKKEENIRTVLINTNKKYIYKERLTYGKLLNIDTIIFQNNGALVLNKCFKKNENRYSYNLGFAEIKNDFIKDFYVVASGSKEHCLNCVKIRNKNISIIDVCKCDYCSDSKLYKDKHPNDTKFIQTNIKTCQKGCQHGY